MFTYATGWKRWPNFDLKSKESLAFVAMSIWYNEKWRFWCVLSSSFFEKWEKTSLDFVVKIFGLGRTCWVWLSTLKKKSHCSKKMWQCVPCCWPFLSEKESKRSSYYSPQQRRQAYPSHMHYRANVISQLSGKSNLSHTMISILFVYTLRRNFICNLILKAINIEELEFNSCRN